MKTAMKKLAASLVLAGAAVTAPAMAATISWNNAEFDLTLSNGTNSGKTWDVTYSADFSGYSPSNGTLTHIAWKIAGKKIDLDASNNPSIGGAGDLEGGQSQGSCGAAGNNEQWVCLDVNPTTTTGTYSWKFTTTFLDSIESLGAFSLKGRFLDGEGRFQGLMSCDVDANGTVGGSTGCGSPSTEVPLPGTLGLLGLGLTGLGAIRRRKA